MTQDFDTKDWAVLALITLAFVLLGLGASHTGADLSGVSHVGRG